MVIALNIAGLQ